MNKFFTSTLSLLCLALTASAQSVQFYFHGQPVADGTTVTIEAETDVWGELVCETNPVESSIEGLVLKNLTNSAINGTASLSIHRSTMQPKAVTWCMGSECVNIAGDTYNNKQFTVPASGSINTQLDATPGEIGEMTARIQVEANLKTTTVYVRFLNPDPAGPSLRFMRRSIVEEYTGTWCDNCPRGFVGMQRLTEDFGDRCIVVHAHVGNGTDPMNNKTYEQRNGSHGVPMAYIDRDNGLNPYDGSAANRSPHHYGIDADFAAALAVPTEAGLELTAEWDEMQRDVVYTANTTFNINSANAPYRLVFFLLENGLKGTGKTWAQSNAFSSEAGSSRVNGYEDDDMKFWVNGPHYVEGLEYDHVPVNTKGLDYGIENSITAPIVSGQTQTYTDKVTTFKQSVIQDKEKLYAAAMLINTETGLVVNAAQAKIQAHGATGITTLQPTHATADDAIYDLQGRRLQSKPAKGLYIQGGRKHIVRQ